MSTVEECWVLVFIIVVVSVCRDWVCSCRRWRSAGCWYLLLLLFLSVGTESARVDGGGVLGPGRRGSTLRRVCPGSRRAAGTLRQRLYLDRQPQRALAHRRRPPRQPAAQRRPLALSTESRTPVTWSHDSLLVWWSAVRLTAGVVVGCTTHCWCGGRLYDSLLISHRWFSRDS